MSNNQLPFHDVINNNALSKILFQYSIYLFKLLTFCGMYLIYWHSQFFFFQNQTIFSQIVKDIFAGLPEPNSGSSHNITGSHVRAAFDLDAALESSTRDKGLIAHKPFLEKCVQLYNIAQVHQGDFI